MNQATLNTEKDKSPSNKLVLIIDKKGILGEQLVNEFETKNILSVFVSSLTLKQSEILSRNVLSNKTRIIPFPKNRERIPSIPDLNYAYIFVFCLGEKEILEVIPNLIKKAENTKGKIILVLSNNLYGYEWARAINNLYRNIYTIFVGDIFNQTTPFKIPSITNRFFFEAFKTSKIKISNSGLLKVYPVYLEDAIKKIVEVSLNDKKIPKVYFLFQKNNLTELSLTHLFHKIDPLIGIDFADKKDKELEDKEINFVEGEYLLEEDYPLKERIKEVLDNLGKEKKPSLKKILKSEDNIHIKANRKTKSPLIVLLLYILSLIIFLPIVITLILSLIGVQQLKVAKSSIEKGNFEQAKNSSSFAKSCFNLSNEAAKTVVYEANIIGKKDTVTKYTSLIEKGEEGSSAIFYLSQSLENFMRFLVSNNGGSKEQFNAAANSLKDAIVVFQKFKAEGIFDQTFSFLNVSILHDKKIDNSIELATGLIDVLPNTFGFDREHRYLLLFQNNMELRPGGGFIGSYGELVLNKGKITSFVIHDVYDADGQLKGHIEPPFAIRRYLNQVHWYLRDSNFDVDFTKNASSAAYFLNEEMGEKVDGVIGVDVSFVKEILNAIGATYVPDYKETVTADNLYMLTETHAEKNFFAGSSQKKDFLRSLFNAIELKINAQNNISYPKLLEAIVDSVQEKHLLFAFEDQTVQSLFTANNMSSSLWDNRKTYTNTINDYLGISEANLGVNKANYFIKRKISDNVKIDDSGSVLGKATIAYKNTNLNGVWPGGNYKNYLQIILPFGAEITAINIDGINQPTVPAVTTPITYESKKFSPPKELEVEKTFESGKVIYGFLVMIPVNTLKTIEISYSLPKKIELDLPVFSYSQKFLKQPGTDADPINFSLSYPESFKLLNSDLIDSKLENKNNQVYFSGNLKSDINFTIQFTKK